MVGRYQPKGGGGDPPWLRGRHPLHPGAPRRHGVARVMSIDVGTCGEAPAGLAAPHRAVNPPTYSPPWGGGPFRSGLVWESGGGGYKWGRGL